MNEEQFRNLALALPEAEERSHMSHPDFRVRGKIFATLWPGRGRGVVKLNPEQQQMFMDVAKEAFTPAQGAWGRAGSTVITFEEAHDNMVEHALRLAWRNTAPRALRDD
jgi:hypothetical protein